MYEMMIPVDKIVPCILGICDVIDICKRNSLDTNMFTPLKHSYSFDDLYDAAIRRMNEGTC